MKQDKAVLNMNFCASQHKIPQVTNGAMFMEGLEPSDIKQIEHDAEIIMSVQADVGTRQINFYMTELTAGLTVALVAAIKAAIKHGIGLTLWHYDRDSEGYLPQIVTEYKEPEDLIDTILRLYDALVTVERKPFPQVGDKYWYIDDGGLVKEASYCVADFRRHSIGNMYQTEQATKDALRAKKLIKTINDRRKELNGDWVADWEDESQTKYGIDYVEYCELYYNRVTGISFASVVYPFGAFKNAGNCQQVINEYRHDLLWYFTEYLPEVTS